MDPDPQPGAVPPLRTLPVLLERQARTRPDAVAIRNGPGEGLSFGELWNRASRLRAHLEAEGVGEGDRVALVGVSSLPLAVGIWGTLAAGATAVPLNYRLPAADLAWMMRDARAKALLADRRYLEALAAADEDAAEGSRAVVCLDGEWSGARTYDDALSGEPTGAQRSPVEVDLDRPIYILYTSGTTARPKGVVQRHRGYAISAAGPSPVPPEVVRFLHALPLYHLAGLASLTVQLSRGSRVVLLDHFAPASFVRAIERHRANVTFLVPTMMCDLVEYEGGDDVDTSSLAAVSYGASPMPVPVLLRMMERFPGMYIQLYSQTEGTSRVTMLGPEDHVLSDDPETREVQVRRLSSIGKVMEGAEVRIRDEEGRDVPTGEIGDLWYRTPGRMCGYLTEDGETRAEEREGWIVSGDRARIDEDGYVYLAGRAKDFLIRGGENIAPREIEEVLEAHPLVAEAAVVGRPDDRWGEVPVAFVRCPGDRPEADELLAACRERLAGFKVPEEIRFRDAFPRGTMGKTLKRALVEELVARP